MEQGTQHTALVFRCADGYQGGNVANLYQLCSIDEKVEDPQLCAETQFPKLGNKFGRDDDVECRATCCL